METNFKITHFSDSSYDYVLDRYPNSHFHKAFHPSQVVETASEHISDCHIETEIQYNSIPVNIINEYAKYFSSLIDITISAGSGAALLEKFLVDQKFLSFTRLICVDPNPLSYNSRCPIHIKPKYSYVKDLLKQEPKVKNDSGLMLIWPSPNDSTYDIESIQDLRPRTILILAAPDGSSGGSKLLSWLRDIEHHNPVNESTLSEYELIAKYDSIRITQHDLYHIPNCIRPTLYLMKRKDVSSDSVSIPNCGTRYTLDDAQRFLEQMPSLESYLNNLDPEARLSAYLSICIGMMSSKLSDIMLNT